MRVKPIPKVSFCYFCVVLFGRFVIVICRLAFFLRQISYCTHPCLYQLESRLPFSMAEGEFRHPQLRHYLTE